MKFTGRSLVRMLVVTLLVVQLALMFAVSATPREAPQVSVRSLMGEIGGWKMSSEIPVDPQIMPVLSADGLVSRLYSSQAGTQNVDLWIAYYRSQHQALKVHSPSVCLPGAGWKIIDDEVIDAPFAGGGTISRWTVSKGNTRMKALFWYQTSTRAIAQDHMLNVYRLVDTIRGERSDLSLVRLMVVDDPAKPAMADETALAFAKDLSPAIQRVLNP